MVNFLKRVNPSKYYVGYDDDTDKWCVFGDGSCISRHGSSARAWEALSKILGRGKLIENYPYAANPGKPLTADAVSLMSAANINKSLDKLDAESSEIVREMIAAGRGTEKPSETFKKSDPLSMRFIRNSNDRYILHSEIARRYGPGAPHRLPSGRRVMTVRGKR